MEEKVYTTESWVKTYDRDGNLVAVTHSIYPAEGEDIELDCGMECGTCDIFDDIDEDIDIEEEDEGDFEIEIPDWAIIAGAVGIGAAAVKLIKRIFR